MISSSQHPPVTSSTTPLDVAVAINETLQRIDAMGLLSIKAGLVRHQVDTFDKLETIRETLERRMHPFMDEIETYDLRLKTLAYGTALIHQYSNAVVLSDSVEVGSFEQSTMFMALMHANYPELTQHFAVLTALIHPPAPAAPLRYPFILCRPTHHADNHQDDARTCRTIDSLMDTLWSNRSDCKLIGFDATPSVIDLRDCGSLLELHERFLNVLPPISGGVVKDVEVLDPTDSDSRVAMG